MYLGEYRRDAVATSERKKTPSLIARCWDEISQRGYVFTKSLSGPRSLSDSGDKTSVYIRGQGGSGPLSLAESFAQAADIHCSLLSEDG
jgi:hypothetical protein